MSEFAVTIEKIKDIQKHPNADRLSIATLNRLDFKFVTLLDQFKPGDLVVYFPVDSILPDAIVEKLDLKEKLTGSAKNRIRTVRLRKAFSQGVVADPFNFPEITGELKEGLDVTKLLGVFKYEKPEVVEPFYKNKSGKNLKPLPAGVKMYDIESVQRHPEVIEYLQENNTKVFVTEKLEGTSFWATYYTDKKKYAAGSRTVTRLIISENWLEMFKVKFDNFKRSLLFKLGFKKKTKAYDFPESVWETVFYQEKVKDKLTKIALEHFPNAKQITLRGEIIGDKIQENIYNFPADKYKLFYYDVEVDGKPIDIRKLFQLSSRFGLALVPVLEYDKEYNVLFAEKTPEQYANGASLLFNTLREGIVIRPSVEEEFITIGRLQLKFRDLEYLAKHEEL